MNRNVPPCGGMPAITLRKTIVHPPGNVRTPRKPRFPPGKRHRLRCGKMLRRRCRNWLKLLRKKGKPGSRICRWRKKSLPAFRISASNTVRRFRHCVCLSHWNGAIWRRKPRLEPAKPLHFWLPV